MKVTVPVYNLSCLLLEAADSKNQGGMKRLAAAAPKPLSPDGSGEGKVHDYEELPSPKYVWYQERC